MATVLYQFCLARKIIGTIREYRLSFLQPFVSALFVIEIAGLLAAHLFYSPSQCRLFYTNSYYWYLIIVAVCSMIASIPVPQLYNPQMVSNGLAFFQVCFNNY